MESLLDTGGKDRRRPLRAEGVCKEHGIPKQTLANWRCRGVGPPYHKHGGIVIYYSDELDDWAEANRRL